MTRDQRIMALNRYKRKNKEDHLILIPIYDTTEKVIAYLHPLTWDYKETIENCIPMLSKWRRENPTAATGTFEVTDERTENWLINYVLKNENRIIFLIEDCRHQYIGHIGLAQFDDTKRVADIDAVLRGVKNVFPGLMGLSLLTIMKWGKQELDLEGFYLETFYDNIHAIEFYKRNFFTEVEKIPLKKVFLEEKQEEKWEVDHDIDPDKAGSWSQRMKFVGEL